MILGLHSLFMPPDGWGRLTLHFIPGYTFRTKLNAIAKMLTLTVSACRV